MDGFERMFQVNYVAQFLLVQLLLPLMRDTPSASRIILTASSTHATACGNLGLGEQDEDGNQFCFDETIDNCAFNYLPLDKKRFESVPASAWGCGYGPYSVSKYLMIQFGKELAKRELGNNVYAYSFAPGPINTGLLPGTFDCCFVNKGYGWPGPQCRWDLPYVGPTDEAGNPNPPPYSVPNFWVSPEHGTMSPMFAALQADESDSGSFISTYYECEIEAGYIPQGITETGQAMIYDQSMEWAGLLDEEKGRPIEDEIISTSDESSGKLTRGSAVGSGSSSNVPGFLALMAGIAHLFNFM